MNRLSLPQRLTLQLVVVLTLVLAIDNVRIPAGVEADSRGRRGAPTTVVPPTSAPSEQGRGNDGRDPADVEDRGNEQHGNCGSGNGTESAPVGNSGVDCPGNGRGGDSTTTAPEPATSVPESTVSPTTAPETTAPEPTVPETTAPDDDRNGNSVTTTPNSTTPETTVPDDDRDGSSVTTTPDSTVPETTIPDDTTPATSTPPIIAVPNPALPGTSIPSDGDASGGGSTDDSTPVVEQPIVTVVLPPSTVIAAPDTRVPTTQPLVNLENGSSELQVGTDLGSTYVVSATPPPNLFGQVELDLELASRVNQTAVDLGYVSIRLDATGLEGESIERFSRPVRVRMQQLPSDGIVAMSSDEFAWEPIPLLGTFSLADDQTAGYFVDAEGDVVVLTKTTGLFGIRKQRPALEIADLWTEMVPGSATKLSVMGQIGEDPVVLSVGGSGNACAVSDTGVVRAVDGGTCEISAVQGGGSMYMSATAAVVTTSVTFIDELQQTVVKYRTSIGMVFLVVLLVLFLVWQMGQTVADVRRALHTDPEAL